MPDAGILSQDDHVDTADLVWRLVTDLLQRNV